MEDEMNGSAGADRVQLGKKYLCFPMNTKEDAAMDEFLKRYRYAPDQMVLERGMLWLGPVICEDGMDK